MFALSVEFLTGRYGAASPTDRDAGEWPPHPARLFAAFVAAMYEVGGDPAERRFLEWWQDQAPPVLTAGRAEPVASPTVFVPVNDAMLPARGGTPAAALAVLPEHRSRQPRTFPCVRPEVSRVHFAWPDALPDGGHLDACRSLASRVAYLGHSSSLVAVRVESTAPPPDWSPVDASALSRTAADELRTLRVPRPGQLDALDHCHAVYVRTGVRPAAPWEVRAYRWLGGTVSSDPAVLQSVFGEVFTFRRESGTGLSAAAAGGVALALRRLVLDRLGGGSSEALTGVDPEGRPSRRPHVAFAAIPDVRHRFADGHLLGAAVVLPRSLAPENRSALLRALGTDCDLDLGVLGTWQLAAVEGGASAMLEPDTWTEPARAWATATPIELDRFPRRSSGQGSSGRDLVVRACEHVGLPCPTRVVVGPTAWVPGPPPARAFRGAARPGGAPPRPLVHAALEFAGLVEGPVLLGSGRYRGLGLCVPVPNGRLPQWWMR